MDNKCSGWENLPTELLEIILRIASNQQSTIKSCNVALVCKAWKDAAQAAAYSNIIIETVPQFKKFHKIISQSSHLGTKIKALHLKFDIYEIQKVDKEEVSYLSTSLVTTSLPNLEVLEKDDLYTCVPTLHLLLESQLKNLKELMYPIYPNEENEVANYVKCALLMKDRIQNIYIWQSSSTDEKITIQYQPLYNNLYQFINLVGIHLIIETDDGIQVLEHIIEACPSLKNILLYLKTPSNNSQSIHSRSNELSKFSSRSRIKSLSVSLIGYHDYNIILYIMRKLPQLRNLSLFLEKPNPQFNIHSITQFLDYVSKIDECLIERLSIDQNNLVETIGNFWEKTSELGSEVLHIDYANFYVEKLKISLDIIEQAGGGGRHTILRYPSDRDFGWGSLMDFIEKSGKSIGTMCFNHEEEDDVNNFELPDDFFPCTFQYCPNLTRLYLNGCILKKFAYSGVRLDKKFSINELCLRYCQIQPGMFEQLSTLLYKIKKLSLNENTAYIPENESDDISKNREFKITMLHTEIDSIAFDVDDPMYVEVFVMADEKHYYYRISSLRGGLVESSTEAEFVASSNEQHVYVTCPTKPRILYQAI